MAESSSPALPGDVEWLPGPGGTWVLRIHPASIDAPALILRVLGGGERRIEAGPSPVTEYAIPAELDWSAAWLQWPDGTRAALPLPHGPHAEVIELRPRRFARNEPPAEAGWRGEIAPPVREALEAASRLEFGARSDSAHGGLEPSSVAGDRAAPGAVGAGSGEPAVPGAVGAGSGESAVPGAVGAGPGEPAVPGAVGAGSGESAVPGAVGAGSGEPAVPGAVGAGSGEPAVPGAVGAGPGEPAVPGAVGAGSGEPAVPGAVGAGPGEPAAPGAGLGDDEAPGAAVSPETAVGAASPSWTTPPQLPDSTREAEDVWRERRDDLRRELSEAADAIARARDGERSARDAVLTALAAARADLRAVRAARDADASALTAVTGELGAERVAHAVTRGSVGTLADALSAARAELAAAKTRGEATQADLAVARAELVAARATGAAELAEARSDASQARAEAASLRDALALRDRPLAGRGDLGRLAREQAEAAAIARRSPEASAQLLANLDAAAAALRAAVPAGEGANDEAGDKIAGGLPARPETMPPAGAETAIPRGARALPGGGATGPADVSDGPQSAAAGPMDAPPSAAGAPPSAAGPMDAPPSAAGAPPSAAGPMDAPPSAAAAPPSAAAGPMDVPRSADAGPIDVPRSADAGPTEAPPSAAAVPPSAAAVPTDAPPSAAADAPSPSAVATSSALVAADADLRLRRALIALAREDGAAAGALLLGLLPAQGALIGDTLTYDLTIRGVGTFAVYVADGSAGVVRLSRRRPRAQALFHLSAEPYVLAELLAGERDKVGRFRRKARLSGRRKRAKELLPLAEAKLSLADAVKAGARLEPGLVYRILPLAVDPEWTRGHTFTVAQQIVEFGPQTWHVSARDGQPLHVVQRHADVRADATVTMSQAAFERMLRNEPPATSDRPQIRGDRDAVAALKRWTDRVRGV